MGETVWDMVGRTAIVTGGSRGIGREVVHALARAGADVMIASRSLDACEAVADEVREATGRRAVPVACHVGQWRDVEALADRAVDEFGRVDALVNNAGMSPRYGELVGVSEELWDKVVAVNLKGAFRLTALIGAHMTKAGGGAIVNVSSVSAERPEPTELPYAAAKAGLNALTIGFAKAFGPTVRVNAVLPGLVRTDVVSHWDSAAIDEFTRQAAIGRISEPAEIARAVMYLLSDSASYATGALLRVDGGFA